MAATQYKQNPHGLLLTTGDILVDGDELIYSGIGTLDKLTKEAQNYMKTNANIKHITINFNDTHVLVYPDSNLNDVFAKWHFTRLLNNVSPKWRDKHGIIE